MHFFKKKDRSDCSEDHFLESVAQHWSVASGNACKQYEPIPAVKKDTKQRTDLHKDAQKSAAELLYPESPSSSILLISLPPLAND